MVVTQLMSTEARGLDDDDDDEDETLECCKNSLWSSPMGFPVHTTMSSDSHPIANLVFFFAGGMPGTRCKVKFGAGSRRDCTSRICGGGMGSLGYWACPVHVASSPRGLVPHTLLIELKEILTQATLDRSFGGRGNPCELDPHKLTHWPRASAPNMPPAISTSFHSSFRRMHNLRGS